MSDPMEVRWQRERDRWWLDRAVEFEVDRLNDGIAIASLHTRHTNNSRRRVMTEDELIGLIRQEVERIGCNRFNVEYVPKYNEMIGDWWRIDVHVTGEEHWHLGKKGSKEESLEDALNDLKKKRSLLSPICLRTLEQQQEGE